MAAVDRHVVVGNGGVGLTSGGSLQWRSGAQMDTPMLADIDGGGKADLIAWRRATGTWYWVTSSSGYDYAAASGKQWDSGALGDTPMTAALDGDARADLAVWRPGGGMWYWLSSSRSYDYAQAGQRQWGSNR